jgi:hypothetical protein
LVDFSTGSLKILQKGLPLSEIQPRPDRALY